MPLTQIREYSIPEIRKEMEQLRRSYDQVRLVDAEECRILHPDGEDGLVYGEECHRVWETGERCANCTSYQAHMTRAVHYKTEYFRRRCYDITSIPVYLRQESLELTPCILELIRAHEADGAENPDRAAESPDFYRTHDSLTRICNQGEGFRRIREKLIAEPKGKYLLICSNIRDFHMLNLLFGRDQGNAILEGIAEILRTHFSSGEIYARTRTDRFLLFIEKERFDPELMLTWLSSLQDLIRSPIYSLKIQLGVYEITNPNIPLSVMLQRAELALQTIRDSHGKQIAWYSEGMMERQMEDQWIISEFQKSLLTDQFQVYYQPQVNMEGRILGAEALVRWIRGDGTLVPLQRFLPVLSRSDLITRMDEHIWELAVMQLSAWRDTPLEDLYVSINIEPKDFLYVNVPEKLEALCRRYQVAPEKLHVEITERALTDEMTRSEELIHALHGRGFTVEIDDFGKGSSSLSMLKDVPADVLKIDMGFLHETEQHIRSKIILESVVRMAEQLKTAVIVEGVETKAQKQGIQDMGCRVYQGFLFSRPIPAAEFERLYLDSLKQEEPEKGRTERGA